MYEINGAAVEEVAGGWTIGVVWGLFGAGVSAFNSWENVMSGIGGTLNNYYGPETTLEIINGGNLGA